MPRSLAPHDEPDTPPAPESTTPRDPLASWWLRVFPFLKRLEGIRPRTFYLLALLPSTVLAATRELLELWIFGFLTEQRPLTRLEELGVEVWHRSIYVMVFVPVAGALAAFLLPLLAARIVRRPPAGRGWIGRAALWIAVLFLSFAGLVAVLHLGLRVSIAVVLVWSISTAHALAVATIYHAQVALVAQGRSQISGDTLLWFGSAFFGTGLLGGLIPILAGRNAERVPVAPTGRDAEPIEPE
jgi:hypothetical protein